MGIYEGEISYYDALENLSKMPHQRLYVNATEPRAAYVGGQGAGKSVALCTSAIKNAMEEPNGFSLIGRLHMPELESSTMKTFLEMVPEQYFEWHDTKKLGKFWNGHEIIFRHLDTADPKIKGHIKSMNLSGAYVDEGTEVSEEMYFLLIGRLRRKTAKRRVFRLASNPNGHDWVWRNFFDTERSDELKKFNFGITASTLDNPFLPQEDYIQGMLNTYPKDWADRFIYGSFSDFSGSIYKEFSDKTHVWDANSKHAVFGNSNKPPKEWPVIIGIDIGSDIDPWAIPIIAIAPNGMLFQDGEVYGNNMLVRHIADELHEKIGGRKVFGMAYDYSNRQCALELAECGIAGSEAIKEVRPGLFKVAQYFHIDQRLINPFTGLLGSPRYFMSSECVNARREVPAYKWAKDSSGKTTGEPAHPDSHSPDGIRYAVHTFRPLPQKMEVPKLWENPALDEASRQYWRDAEKYKDPMERFNPQLAKTGEAKTVREWEREALRPPRRFVRPTFANYRRT